uniref:Type I polyketide synthase n=1 Tax=Gambierdiscus excentricus TaxID=986170 RepID=A0A1S6K7V9_9DINO|nr:type I polyketide synthase [Gambierdiscus excentricus]
MATDPVISGLRVGGLVELYDLDEQQLHEWDHDVNGELGQVVSYTGGDINKFFVHLICGASGYVDPKHVRAPKDCSQAVAGGDLKSFDILVGPKTDGDVLGSEISTCILEKGYCILKTCQGSVLRDRAMETLRELGENGHLARLPEEIEEGYLGRRCRGKVTWLDSSRKGLAEDEYLATCDASLSYIAQALQPFSPDILESWVEERTPALVCLTLTDDEEPEYPAPEADDGSLGTFLKTWRRSLLQAVHFSGPGEARVELEAKGTAPQQPGLAWPQQQSVEVSAATNTVLLFRPDLYDYTCEIPEKESLMLITSFLSPADRFLYNKVEGDTSWLVADGPPPPPGTENLFIVNTTERLPGHWDNQWAFFAGLTCATDTVIKIPIMRWDVDIYWSPDENNFQPWQTTTRHQSYCEGADLFDNRHFEISNAEAQGLDPVMRLTLECGAQSLAMIGLSKKQANRKSTHAGFNVGNDKLDWATLPKDIGPSAAMGGTSTNLAILANRFNFVFNLKGPSFVCDTACSASLTSMHCARKCILDREYDQLEWFLCMGSHLCLASAPFIGGSQSHMNTAKGRCFTFNASADGYLRGEGICGCMLKYGALKDESDALLRASMLGQDGRSASLTAPNGPAQEEMITRCIKEAKMTPPESTVWECHGTGTSLGDPIEVGAVRKLQVRMRRLEPLMLTSAKTNIGHLEGSAAMGGICKCILQCKHSKCCSTLHLRTLNPHLEHAAFEAIFQTEGACYTYMQGHSQVSSFGFGGANGHAIFWGRNLDAQPDVDKLFMKKMEMRPAPRVNVLSTDPAEWEADFPDTRGNIRPGARWSLTLSPDDAVDEPLQWKFEENGPDLDADVDDEVFYAITGNFNDWADDRLAAGEIAGVHTTTVDMPDSGVLEFRILVDGDPKQVLCPASPQCTRRTEEILGPAEGLTNLWVVSAAPGKEVQVELFVRRGMKSITWLVPRD